MFEVASTAEGLFAAEFLVYGFPRGNRRPEVRYAFFSYGVAVFDALDVIGAQADGVVAPRGYLVVRSLDEVLVGVEELRIRREALEAAPVVLGMRVPPVELVLQT